MIISSFSEYRYELNVLNIMVIMFETMEDLVSDIFVKMKRYVIYQLQVVLRMTGVSPL